MANYQSENILVGAAAVHLAAPGVEFPATVTDGTLADADAASDALETAEWRTTGYTSGGVEVTYTPDFGEVEVDQLLDAAVMFKQRMTVTVGTTLSEASLDNLVFAWGQADDTITPEGEPIDWPNGPSEPGPTVTRSLTVASGKLGDRPLERQLAFIGQAPAGNAYRAYRLHRCLNVESSAHSLSRADATTIPVSLRCLPNNDGQYGTITDVVAAPVVP